MTYDPANPPPPARPFSRPTHPSIPAIVPEGGVRPARPTPYAAAAIRTPADGPALEPRRETAASDEPEATAPGRGRLEQGSEAAPVAAPRNGSPPAPARAVLGTGSGGGGGVPANPEAGLERVDSVSDYPDDAVGSPAAVFGWTEGVADDVGPAGSRQQAAGGAPETSSDLAAGAAQLLEGVARTIRRGQLVLPAMSWPQTAPAVLAGVLTALLAREAQPDLRISAGEPVTGAKPPAGTALRSDAGDR